MSRVRRRALRLAPLVVSLAARVASANGPIGDAPVFARIEALRPVAAAIAIDGDGAGAPLSTEGARRCTVIGAPHPCDARDSAVLRRKLAVPSRAPGIAQVCPAALGT